MLLLLVGVASSGADGDEFWFLRGRSGVFSGGLVRSVFFHSGGGVSFLVGGGKLLLLRGGAGGGVPINFGDVPVRCVFLSFCGGVGFLVIPGDGASVRVAVGDGGRLFRSPVHGPAAADLSAPPFLLVLMADGRSSTATRAGGSSGRRFLRQIHALESSKETGGGSCSATAALAGDRDVQYCRGLSGSLGVNDVISFVSRGSFVRI